MDFPSVHPGHSRRGVVNVSKFSTTKLSSPHPGRVGTYSRAVGGPLPAFSFPPGYLPFHGAALSTLLHLHFLGRWTVRSDSVSGILLDSDKRYSLDDLKGHRASSPPF